MRTAGPLAALAALVVGMLAGEARGPDPATAGLVAGIALLIVAFAMRESTSVAVVLMLIGCLLLGGAVMQRALHGLDASPLRPMIERRAFVDATATLVDDPSGPRFTVEVPARLHQVDRRDAGSRTVLLTGSGELTSLLRVLEAGDHVSVRGTLQPLTGFDERYRWRHAVAELAVSELVDFAPPTSPVIVVANRARSSVLAGAGGLPPTEHALLAGFLLGDTRAIPADLVDAFRDSGLSHLLAVSGANVAFVLALALPLLGRSQLGVLPVLLPVFGTVPLVALPANLLAVPVVGPLTVWGVIAGVVGGIAGPGAARVLQLPTYALLRWVELVATTAAAHPMAVDGRGLVGLLALACAAVATLRAVRRPAGRLDRDAPLPPR